MHIGYRNSSTNTDIHLSLEQNSLGLWKLPGGIDDCAMMLHASWRSCGWHRSVCHWARDKRQRRFKIVSTPPTVRQLEQSSQKSRLQSKMAASSASTLVFGCVCLPLASKEVELSSLSVHQGQTIVPSIQQEHHQNLRYWVDDNTPDWFRFEKESQRLKITTARVQEVCSNLKFQETGTRTFGDHARTDCFTIGEQLTREVHSRCA